MADQGQQNDSAAGLIAAQAVALAQLRARIKAMVRRVWAGLPNYRSSSAFVASVVPVVQSGQRQTAAITAAYLSQLYALKVGAPVQMVGVPPGDVTGLRKGVTPAEVYERPFHLVWRDLADAQKQRDAHYEWHGPTENEPERPPLPPDDYVDRAIQHGLERAQNLAETDLQLAKQHAALHVMGHQDKVVGYRRVLEGAYSCGLCIVAATQRYHKADLLALHPACDCSVEIITDADWRGGREISAVARNGDGQLVPIGELPDVHERISDTFGKDSAAARAIGVRGSRGEPIHYRDAIITHANGELGPVLAVRGQGFLGPRDIAKHVTPQAS